MAGTRSYSRVMYFPNRLHMNRIPWFLLRFAYSACRPLILPLVFFAGQGAESARVGWSIYDPRVGTRRLGQGGRNHHRHHCHRAQVAVYIYIYIYIYMCMCLHTYMHIYIKRTRPRLAATSRVIGRYTHTHMYMYVYIYMHTQTHTHTHTHIYIYEAHPPSICGSVALDRKMVVGTEGSERMAGGGALFTDAGKWNAPSANRTECDETPRIERCRAEGRIPAGARVGRTATVCARGLRERGWGCERGCE